MPEIILSVRGLKTQFKNEERIIPAVDGIDVTIHARETVGIVGESGCGKSATSLSVMRLLPENNAAIAAGEILFKGEDLAQYTEAQMQKLRGKDIAMIFQDPMTSLNPVYTIGRQLTEGIELHLSCGRREAYEHALQMLGKVKIPRPEQIMKDYPHQLSGGMRQRVMIAMALACSPELLIADEPTTALDVTVQAQILDLMNELKEREKTAIIMITHDLGVIAQMCQAVYVMYAGQIVENADINGLLGEPLHPYTQGLMASMPENNEDADRLRCIPGNVPLPGTIRQGCRFFARCAQKQSECARREPPLFTVGENRLVRCWRFQAEGMMN
ncbi:MAG: ABC transporter ATP-binding protein [Acidaminococcales bacterium]|jgi:peptide/nickel transport system ATP-binding protein|nr:ABC transporter ATP-binding protein [Acidaminococcales bacterium]